MVVQDPAHLAGRRQGAAGRDGVAAHQPPARLPGLRQGRRVPAAEPGDEQRPRPSPASTASSAPSPSRSTSPRRCCSTASAACSCARCTRFSDQIAGDPFIELLERGALQQVGIYEDQPFESYFSGNTVQICPVGALTGAAYRFRSRPFDLVSHAERLRALRVRLRACAPTTAAARSCAGWPATTRRSTRSGTATRAAGPSSTPPRTTASPRRWSATRTARWCRRRGPRRCDIAATGLAAAGRDRRARRRPGHRRGRLRLREVRPGRARHQRHRLPRPPALRRGGATSSPRTSPARGLGVTYADLEQAPAVLLVGLEPEEESPILFLRLRKAVPQAALAGLTRSRRSPRRGLDEAVGPPAPGRARRRGRRCSTPWPRGDDGRRRRRAVHAGSVILVGERLAAVPGALSRRRRGWPRPTGARLAWVPAPGRRARRARGRRAARPAARRPPGRRRRLPGSTSPPPGASTRCRTTRAATPPASSPPSHTGELARAARRRRRPGRPARPRRRARRARRGRRSSSASSCAPRAVTERADVVLPGRAGRREGRHLPRLGGPRPAVRRGAPRHHRRCPTSGCCTSSPTRWASTSACPTPRPRAASSTELGALGRRPRRLLGRAVARAGAAGGRRGRARDLAQLLDAGRLQDGEPFLAGTARPAVGRLSAATAAERSASPTATRSPSPPTAARSRVPVAGHRHARRRRLAAHQLGRRPGPAGARGRPGLARAAHRRGDRGPAGRWRMSHAAVVLASPEVPGFGNDPWWLVLGKAVAIFVVPGRDDAVHDLVRSAASSRACSSGSGPTGSARSACCRASPTASSWR